MEPGTETADVAGIASTLGWAGLGDGLAGSRVVPRPARLGLTHGWSVDCLAA